MNTNITRPTPAAGRWAPELKPPNYPQPEPDPVLPAEAQQSPDPEHDEPTTAEPTSRRATTSLPSRPILAAAAAVVTLGIGVVAIGVTVLADQDPVAAPLPTAAPPSAAPLAAPSFFDGGPCPNTVEGKVVRGDGPGGATSGPHAILAFQYAYYVTRSGDAARAVVAPESMVSPADMIQQGINTIPAGTRHCLTITELESHRFRAELIERRPATSAANRRTEIYNTYITTVTREGRTLIDSITGADR